MDSVTTYAPGGQYNVTLAGTAVHNGGSCQLSLSYDQGETFQVFQSFIGGCPDTSNPNAPLDFTMPSDAPAGEALLAWTWVNHSGNREMYMNCASITVGSGKGSERRSSGLDSSKYPSLFVANAGVNQCATVEGIDVVYPNPGPNVVYGGSYASSKPTTPAGFTGSNCVAPGASSAGSATVDSSAASSPSASSGSKSVSVHPNGVTLGSSAASLAAEPVSTASSAAASGSSGSSGSSSSSGSKTCQRKRRLGGPADRNLTRRTSGRVAALPATHPKRDVESEPLFLERRATGRVAALPATHPKRDVEPERRAESEPFFLERRTAGRVAALPATHPGAAAHRKRASGRVAALPATHGH